MDAPSNPNEAATHRPTPLHAVAMALDLAPH